MQVKITYLGRGTWRSHGDSSLEWSTDKTVIQLGRWYTVEKVIDLQGFWFLDLFPFGFFFLRFLINQTKRNKRPYKHRRLKARRLTMIAMRRSFLRKEAAKISKSHSLIASVAEKPYVFHGVSYRFLWGLILGFWTKLSLQFQFRALLLCIAIGPTYKTPVYC